MPASLSADVLTYRREAAAGGAAVCRSAAKQALNARAKSDVALNVLQIIPRFVGGGPERSLLAFAAAERVSGFSNRHVVVILEATGGSEYVPCGAAPRRSNWKFVPTPRRSHS